MTVTAVRFAGGDAGPTSNGHLSESEADGSGCDDGSDDEYELVEVERSTCESCGTTFTDAFECPECGSRTLTSEVVVRCRPSHR